MPGIVLGGLLNDQPAQYGFLLNYVNGSDVFQIWNTQSNGPMYTRSGNASGWGRSWTKLIDSSSIGSQTVNKAKYASVTTPGTASLKNIKAWDQRFDSRELFADDGGYLSGV